MHHRYYFNTILALPFLIAVHRAPASTADLASEFKDQYPSASARLEKIYTNARMVTIRTSQYKRDGKQHMTESVVTNLRRGEASLWNQKYLNSTNEQLSTDTQFIYLQSPTLSFSALRRSDEKEFTFDEYKLGMIHQGDPPSPYSILDIKLIDLIRDNPIDVVRTTWDNRPAMQLTINDIQNKNKPVIILDPTTWAILAWEIPTKGEKLRGRNTYEDSSIFPPKLTSFMNLEETPDSGAAPRYSRESKVIDLHFAEIPADAFTLPGAGITQPAPSYDIVDFSEINPRRQFPSAETQPGTQPAISQEAREVFSLLDQFRKNTHSLARTGVLSVHLSSGEKSQDQQISFTSSFTAPNLFRYEVPKRLLLGCDGKIDYIAALGINSYQSVSSHSTQVAGLDRTDARFALYEKQSIIHLDDPTLGILLDTNPVDAMISNAKTISSFSPQEQQLAGLEITTSQPNKLVRRYWFDRSSGLLIRAEFSAIAADSDSSKPKSVITLQISYLETQINTTPAAGSFDFVPPPRSRDLTDKWPALIGTLAPSITLTNIHGQSISLADLKGQVVLLDFWSTWCNYCIDGLDELQKRTTELTSQNVKIFAIGKDEDLATSTAFANQKKYPFPICPDPNAAISARFGVNGIPQTVIIGKDGIIKDIIVGSGPRSQERIRNAINAASQSFARLSPLQQK